MDPGIASPHKQWVTDSSIKKSKVIDGVILTIILVKRTAQE